MKILVLADEESKALWDYFDQSRLDGIDLVISCGDLNPKYLSFIATFTKAPVIYVHGNHDDRYAEEGPDGCICIDDDIYEYKGLRIMGLGGSMRYKPGEHQYTDKEMRKRLRKMRHKLVRHRGIDVLVTHAPARGLGDAEDLPHRGFETFVSILDKYEPLLYCYGHVHKTYGDGFVREMQHGKTRMINAYERYTVEIPDMPEIPERWLSMKHFKRWRWEKFRK